MSGSGKDDQAGLFEPSLEADSTHPPTEVSGAKRTMDESPSSMTTPDRRYSPAELERLKEILENSGDYKVLRRSGATREFTKPELTASNEAFRAIYVDVETTGLDGDDAIIELGMVVFEYDEHGHVLRVVSELDQFEDPGRPLPREIVELTGITDEQVRGRRIDDAMVAEIAAGANLVIAHNAGFDRPLVEKRFPFFKSLAWACSVADVDWHRAGIRDRKLEYLAMARGFFFDSHRAINDCLAGVELLAGVLAADADATALSSLITNSRRESVRLWAESSPFESKELLKGRKYRWNPAAKLWWRDLAADAHDAELDWLAASVYARRLPLPYFTVDATLRYSRRLPGAPPRDAPRR